MEIKDSGARKEFETGAVRDIREGKGRCDLLPLDVVSDILNDDVFNSIYHYIHSADYLNCTPLRIAIKECCDRIFNGDIYTMILEVSKHFEAGAQKYGERNWEKGIPVHCYLDSAIRHYLKYLRGDTDEPHNRAAIWNLLCACWTIKNKPELIDF